MSSLAKVWHRCFLEERPSLMLGLFRVAVALTTGLHLLPTFVPLADNYLATAFKVQNTNLFPPLILELVQRSPDGLVVWMVAVFCVSWFMFLTGWQTRFSGIVMTLSAYYFYALNAFAVGRVLAFDILLVTLFLMCLTTYPGDYFSVDCLRGKDSRAYRRERPFFLQRLLQVQLASIFFYTALHKITGEGNWLTDNPLYYLMNVPSAGVTKYFLLRGFLAARPEVCYGLGIFIVVMELLLPFLLFIRRTRISAIYLGFVFHITLILTLDVPAIFFFLFPAQLLLFVDPRRVLRWIERKRMVAQSGKRSRLVYDGHCRFCINSVKKLQVMDLFATLELIDYHKYEKIETLHPDLTRPKAHSQLHLILSDGTLYGGFAVIRRLGLTLPMMYPLIPLLYFPGSGLIGPVAYRWVARNRYLFHRNQTCSSNACFRENTQSKENRQ